MVGGNASGKTGSVPCVIDSTSATCSFNMVPEISCEPVVCTDNPCDTNSGFLALTGSWNYQDTALCNCRDSTLERGTDFTGNGCPIVCSEVNGVAVWDRSNGADCSCVPPMCAGPAAIPNGYRLTTSSFARPTSTSTQWTPYADGGGDLQVNTWATYDCDPGYTLTHTYDPANPASGGDVAASRETCARQCYNPKRGCENDQINYLDLSPIAVLDPLNCYCKPAKCDQIQISDLGTDHEFTEAQDSVLQRTHYPINGFNSVDVRCRNGLFSTAAGSGDGNIESLTCTTTQWSSPGTCARFGCVNPRSVAGSYLALGLRLAHTCSSLDRVNVDPVGSPETWVARGDASVVFANSNDDGQELPFGLPRSGNGERVYLADHNSGVEATVVEGSTYRFTCKHNFRAYLNADADPRGLSTADPRDNFECRCESGQWVCNHHCRCESGCHEFSRVEVDDVLVAAVAATVNATSEA